MEYDYFPYDLALDDKFCDRIFPNWVHQGIAGWVWKTSHPCDEVFQPDFPCWEYDLWRMSQAKLRDAEFEQHWYELETPEGL